MAGCRWNPLVVCAALVVLSVTTSARAQTRQTVTFDALPIDFDSYSTYTENGFRLAPIGDPTNHFHTVIGVRGTTGAANYTSDGTPFLFTVSGGAFSLFSIDILDRDTRARFTASNGAVATVRSIGTFMFPAGFRDVSSVRMDILGAPEDDRHVSYDNIQFSSSVVPEPSACALFTGGVLPLLGVVLRRQRARLRRVRRSETEPPRPLKGGHPSPDRHHHALATTP